MRETRFTKDRVIKSPWLRIEEAAAYCGISRTLFDKNSLAVDLPHGGDNHTRIYHVDVLDRWIAGTLDVPFHPPPAKRRRRRIQITADEGESLSLIHPHTGKIY